MFFCWSPGGAAAKSGAVFGPAFPAGKSEGQLLAFTLCGRKCGAESGTTFFGRACRPAGGGHFVGRQNKRPKAVAPAGPRAGV